MKFLYKMKNEVYKIGNISGDVSVKSIKKAEIKECGYDFSVVYRGFDNSNIIDNHKCLIKMHDIK